MIALVHQASSADTAVFETLAIVVSTIIISGGGYLFKKAMNGLKDMHEVKVILVGKDPTDFEPTPPEGMIKTVQQHGKWLEILMKAAKANLTDNQSVQGPASREAVRQIDQAAQVQNGLNHD